MKLLLKHLALQIHVILVCICEFRPHPLIYYHFSDSDLIQKKYEDVHHSLEDNGLKVLDFCVKKRTDHYNNLINT